jgi:hypothetical protein
VRASWIIPVLLLAFPVSMLICSKALVDLAVSKIKGRKEHNWAKTVHAGEVCI